MAQPARAINGDQTDPEKQVLVNPEHRQVKVYAVQYKMLQDFLDFCERGLQDKDGNFVKMNGVEAKGVRQWLRDKGVMRADFWTFEREDPNHNRSSNYPESEGSVLFVAAVDKHGLNGPDWYSMPGFNRFLASEYPTVAKKQAHLRIAEPRVAWFFIDRLRSVWERTREIFNRVVRVF